MTIRLFGSGLCGGLLILAVLTPTALFAAGGTLGACAPTSVKYLASIVGSQTTSGTFVAIHEASLRFRQGGNASSCVIVRFSASTFALSGAVLIRARMDDADDAIPGEVVFSGDDGTSDNAHAYDFIFASVAPGFHTVRIQYRSSNGTQVGVNAHTTVVQHAP